LYLGVAYFDGGEGVKNVEEAVKWLKKADAEDLLQATPWLVKIAQTHPELNLCYHCGTRTITLPLVSCFALSLHFIRGCGGAVDICVSCPAAGVGKVVLLLCCSACHFVLLSLLLLT
jgi:hypothetical protein